MAKRKKKSNSWFPAVHAVFSSPKGGGLGKAHRGSSLLPDITWLCSGLWRHADIILQYYVSSKRRIARCDFEAARVKGILPAHVVIEMGCAVKIPVLYLTSPDKHRQPETDMLWGGIHHSGCRGGDGGQCRIWSSYLLPDLPPGFRWLVALGIQRNCPSAMANSSLVGLKAWGIGPACSLLAGLGPWTDRCSQRS